MLLLPPPELLPWQFSCSNASSIMSHLVVVVVLVATASLSAIRYSQISCTQVEKRPNYENMLSSLTFPFCSPPVHSKINDPNFIQMPIAYIVFAFLVASEATEVFKQPWRSNLTSDLKLVTPITYLSM